MSNQQLRAIAGAEGDGEGRSFPALLKKYQAEIARALPRHINPERMARVALTCFRQTPALARCSPESIFAAVIQASQLGLEPGLQGRAYLIPYKNECTFVPGWKGLVELVNRTGRASAWTGAVFDGDDFDYQLGDSPFVKHRPGLEDDPAKLQYAYAIGRVKGAEWANIEVWTNAKIAKHRDRYNRQGDKHYSYREWEMYARKVPLLQVLKYLPSSPELETALTLNEQVEMGHGQGLTLDGVLSGAPPIYTPPEDNGDADKQPPPQHPVDPIEGGPNRQSEKDRPARVDTGTGEIFSDGPPKTFAQVDMAIDAAISIDDLNLAMDLIRSVPDPAHQATLRKNAEKRARDLAK
jgi:recombination protein RecT